MNCVKRSNSGAQTLLKLIIDNFKSFRDEATYDGEKGEDLYSIIMMMPSC